MISMAEYYIVIKDSECGYAVLEVIKKQQACGRVSRIGRDAQRVSRIGKDAYKIECSSAQDQKNIYAALERAMDVDFPPEDEDDDD